METDLSSKFNLFILDRNFNTVGIVDVFYSLVWTDRYQEAGTIECTVPATIEMLNIIRIDHYVVARFSDRTMIIEEITLDSDVQSGNTMTFKGRSIEVILERRIVWNRVDGSDEDKKVNWLSNIEKILNENVLSPAVSARRIPKLTYVKPTDPYINSLTMDEDHWGDNIYELFTNQCKYYNIGWRILANHETGDMTLEFYRGIDRSWEQENNPWVVFSPSFDNFLNSNYYLTKNGFATVALGVGPKEKTVDQYEKEHILPNVTVTVERDGGGKEGLDRRELAVDCTGITSYVGEDNKTDQIDYEKFHASIVSQMTAKTKTALMEAGTTEVFDGEADITQQFVYGRDFFMGDVVQIQNGFGIDAKSRVSEVLFTYDSGGIKVVPTFITQSE